MRAFNYSAIREQKWDSEIPGPVAVWFQVSVTSFSALGHD